MAYEECEDSEFVFCVDTLVELKKHTELIKHLGILDKYINLSENIDIYYILTYYIVNIDILRYVCYINI